MCQKFKKHIPAPIRYRQIFSGGGRGGQSWNVSLPGLPQNRSAPVKVLPSPAHIPTASTLTKTSLGPGLGIGNFSHR